MKITNIFFFLIAVLFAGSCLKDKGNYNYKVLPDFLVDTSGTQTRFEVYQSKDKITIRPSIVYKGNQDELKGLWRLYVSAGVFDTLSRKTAIDTIISRPPGTYTLEFEALAPSGLKALMQYTVVVLSPISSGWMVAYEKGGNTDVDIIRAPEFIPGVRDTVYRAAYSVINGPMPGKPVSIFYTSANLAHIFTSATGVTVQNTDFRRAQSWSQLFFGTGPESVKPEGFYPGSFNSAILINKGEVYWSDNNLFVGKITADVNGYEAAPFIYPQYGKQGGFYDQKNMRFLTIEQQSSKAGFYPNADASAKFNLNNVGKNLLWIERGFGQNANPVDVYKYAFFKDVSGPGRYLYVINTQTPARPDIAAIDISAIPEIIDARFFEVGNLGPAGFYSTSASVYFFQIDATGNKISTPMKGFQAPAGEEITSMRLLKGIGTFGVNAVLTDDSKYMFVATWNEQSQSGKVYLMSVNVTSGAINPAPLRIWTVAGKIGDMQYKRS